ncbi:MAG TPA: hypothetical protein VG496_09020 [Myxococcales bacterium]|nr:hypothetical protein [Myxococcales bacterium]
MRVRRVVSFLTLLVALTSCQSYVAVPVQPATLVAVAQHSQVKVATKADILFVVDDSLSMSGKQDRLAQALSGFTAALDALRPPIDYQVAVVTTSIFERFGACGPDGDANAAAQCDSDWGAPGYVCKAAACVRTFDEAGQLRLAPGNPGTILQRSAADAPTFSAWVAHDVQAGSAGARQPQAFDAMRKVLSDPSTGFVRDGAKVVIAFVSDAEDCSDPAQNFSMLVKDANGNVIDQCAQQAASDGSSAVSLEPVARYVNFLRSLTNSDGTGKEVEVAAIVSLADGTHEPGLCTDGACSARCDGTAAQQACQTRCANAVPVALCVADCTAECKSFCNGQVSSRRYVEMATAFQGLTANVCSDDASDTLGRLAAVIGIPKQIELIAPPAAIEYLRVHVDRASTGLDCAYGQGFDLVSTVDGPAVRFTGSCQLQPDDIWDIRYLANR